MVRELILSKEARNLWRFDSSSWEQDDGGQSFRPITISGDSEQYYPDKSCVTLSSLLEVKRHTESGKRCSEGFYPADFFNCPYCGGKLVAVADPSSIDWQPPYGDGLGLKLTQIDLSSLDTTHVQEFPLPANEGRLGFLVTKCSSARTRLLLAINRDAGTIYTYNSENSLFWHKLNGCFGEDALPDWSWSAVVASSGAGIVCPSAAGATSISFDWISGKFDFKHSGGKSIGGPAQLEEMIFAPVLIEGKPLILIQKEFSKGWGQMTQGDEFAGPTNKVRSCEATI